MQVVVHGYTESFAMSPDVKIFKNGVQIGTVAHCGETALELDGPCELVFKCSIRSARCRVNDGSHVVLSFDRFTGSLKASLTTEQGVKQEVVKAHKKDSKNMALTLGLVIGIPVVVSIFFFFLFIIACML